jgi:hypothetical protein
VVEAAGAAAGAVAILAILIKTRSPLIPNTLAETVLDRLVVFPQ